jgi:hypothetical protein
MLRQSQGKLLFKSEALLEEFTWLHLESLLNISRIKKQYIINKENRSDILGVNNVGQLVILELKKGGGKGCIDQLVRYKNYLTIERPRIQEFSKVDFNQEFLTIAVASSFSAATKAYAESKLPNCLLLTYQVIKNSNNEYFLIFKTIENHTFSKVKIEIIEDSLFDSLPSFMQGYLLDKPEIRARFLSIIQMILSYSSDIKFDTYINYSDEGVMKRLEFAKYNRQGQVLNNKICADFTYRYGVNFPNENIGLTVYLATVNVNPRNYQWTKTVDGIYVETDDFVNVTELRDSNSLWSQRTGLPLRYPLRTPEIDETFNSFEDYYTNYRKYMKSRQQLRPVTHSDFTSVEGMVQMALEDWSVR